MFVSATLSDEQRGLLGNGKRYKWNFSPSSLSPVTTSTPVNPEESDSAHNPGVENPPATPQRRSATPDIPPQSESQPGSSIPTTGQPARANPPPSTANPLPKTAQNPMAHLVDDIKLPIFKGTGSEDPEQFWFLCDAVWTAKQITDPDVRAAQLITSFRDRALTWFMKFSSTKNPTLGEIKAAIIKEFKKPKAESQSITELKEIQQRRGEAVWDFDQRFKVLLDQVSFTISPAQHKEWFIAALLPHIRTPLMQQKVADQQEALEIAMKLETAPVGDDSGIAQIQAQLAAMAFVR